MHDFMINNYIDLIELAKKRALEIMFEFVNLAWVIYECKQESFYLARVIFHLWWIIVS